MGAGGVGQGGGGRGVTRTTAANMPGKTGPGLDGDNPEWMSADFKRAKTGEDIPAHIRAAFSNTRGRPIKAA
jgi:hypothetical protein